MPYIMRHAKSMTLIFTSTFETKAQAIEQAEGMGLHVGLDVIVEDLQAYGNAAQHHFDGEKSQTGLATAYAKAIRTYLDEVAESDDEALIESVEALAEAIGYDFEEEKTFVLDVRVTAKVKRGCGDVTWSTFGLDVDSVTGDVEVLDFEVRDCNEY